MSRYVRPLLILALALAHSYAATPTDDTSQVTVSATGLVLNRLTNTFDSVISVTNISASSIGAPVWLSVGNLGSAATLSNSAGTAPDGNPYVVLSSAAIQAGESLSNLVVRFSDPTRSRFTPTFKVWGTAAGIGPVTFQPGVNTPLITKTIGSSGGTVSISGTGTQLDGTVVTFPIGAVSSDTIVTLGLNAGTMNPTSGTFPGFSLEMDVTGSHVFNQPVAITIPFTGGANSVPIPYYVGSNGTVRPMDIVTLDRQHGTLTFETFHASLFSWIWQLLFGTPGVVSTGYTPGNNGFQVVNRGTIYNRTGECLGMTAFSLWYWLNANDEGDFYPRFMDVVGTDSTGFSLRGQNVIATRAYTSIAQQWNAYYGPIVTAQENLTPADRYASIYNIIANTEGPVLIYLYQSTGANAHSVLAYSVDDNAKQISIYDPDIPGASETIQYAANTGFQKYCNPDCYDGIVYSGDGSLNLTEPYTNILDDADNNFDNSGGAVIDLTSHTSGETVTSFFQTLSGTVHSGSLLVTKLTALVGPTEFSTNVGTDGTFSIPISLTEGVNHIKFKTEGTTSTGTLGTTSNNFDTQDFTLNAVVPSSVILMTLTWDTNDTDLDTYVIDPTGDYSCFYHKVTADGGTLDRDVITGYGPEHWTLRNTDTVRYNQPYQFRVHYYSNHGHSGPSNYTVTIELYDGTTRQQTYTYTGALVDSNPGNYLPIDTGADWANIASITLTQASANVLQSPEATAPSITRTQTGRLNISIPVPSPEQVLQLKHQ